MTLQEAIDAAGIKTIRTTPTKYTDGVYLEYEGKRIQRPIAQKCKKVILREFGVVIPPEA